MQAGKTWHFSRHRYSSTRALQQGVEQAATDIVAGEGYLQKTPTRVTLRGLAFLNKPLSSAAEDWLLGQDSNLRPIGYEFPSISTGLGLSHHPPDESGEGVGRL